MKIEIFKPFGEGYELMKKILFQPFDLGRWLIIGFAAFLAGHFSAGGFNYNYRGGRGRNFWPAQFEHWQPWMAFVIGVLVLFFLALILVIGWVRARGTFVFTDCIVRNRAAIAEPWREYRKEGNSYFLFFLAVFLVAAAVFAIVIAFVVAAGWIGHVHGHTTSITAIALLIFLFICWMSFAIFVSVVGYFMTPVMYRQRCSAMHAFRQVTRLIAGNLAPFVLFVLFGIVLFLALLLIGAMVSCATCCIALIPYVGTVILLPLFVWLRAFGLLFLRQFGPEYDVWAVLPQPEPSPLPS